MRPCSICTKQECKSPERLSNTTRRRLSSIFSIQVEIHSLVKVIQEFSNEAIISSELFNFIEKIRVNITTTSNNGESILLTHFYPLLK